MYHSKLINWFQEIFIINYLKTIHKGNDSYSPSRQEIKQLLCEADSFVLASHFFWALWSVVNSCVSQITFDYWVRIFSFVTDNLIRN